MNAKYMAVFAVAIMFAGCTVLLVDAGGADVDADDTASKTVYVLKKGTADVEIKTTESALEGYNNTVAWTISSDKNAPTSILETGTEIATVYYEKKSPAGTYILHFKGVAVGSSSYTITYTVTTNINESDTKPLTQTITYTFQVNVLPDSFTATVSGTATNHEAIKDGLTVTYNDISTNDYYFYAIGLPKGLAMNTEGKIYGTPDVDSSVFTSESTKVYPVTIVATHINSNIAIKNTVEISVIGSPYAFTYLISGDALKVETDVFKIVRGQAFNIYTDVGAGDEDYENIDSVVCIDSDGSQKTFSGVNGFYELGSVVGTGSYTVVMTNGDQEQSVRVIVIEPLADVDASIGFIPGISHWYDSTE